MVRGITRASPKSLCRLWLTSCSTAPSVQGLTSRWYGSWMSGNGFSCLPSRRSGIPRRKVAGEKPVRM